MSARRSIVARGDGLEQASELALLAGSGHGVRGADGHLRLQRQAQGFLSSHFTLNLKHFDELTAALQYHYLMDHVSFDMTLLHENASHQFQSFRASRGAFI